MRIPRPRTPRPPILSLSRHRAVIATAATGTLLAGSVLAGVLASGAPAANAGTSHQGRLPAFLYAPYFETWTSDSIPEVARQSGSRYLTLAFLQTLKKGSCTLAWNGAKRQLVQPGGRYVAQIRQLRAAGGDVIPSFGGYSADQGGTEIADSCSSVSKIAQAYESVVTTYGVTRLDMDVEAKSQDNKAGIARRSAAIALLQRWAARHHRHVQIDFTLGVEPGGLASDCLHVLRSALAAGVKITTVNIMAFDYYNSQHDSDMGTEAIEALNSVHAQLAGLYPHRSTWRLWRMEGITLLPGIDDFPRRTEVTYLSEAQDVMYYAQTHPISLITIWAIQRDKGGCPGAIDSNSCSGITQSRWEFSHLLEAYTR
jgi:Glycosyl hydrolases family 18